MDNKTESRNYSLDIARIIAILAVVMIHVSSRRMNELNTESFDFLAAYSFDAFSRFSVPFLFMISGALFLDKNMQLSIGRLWKHNILRIAVIYIVWVAVYAVISLSTMENIDYTAALNAFTTPAYHLWFLPVIISIYAILPFLKTWINNASKEEVRIYLILFVLLNLLKTTLISLDISYSLNRVLGLFSFGTFYTHLSYFILGYYLNNYVVLNLKKRYWLIISIIPIIINIIVGIGRSRTVGAFAAAIFDNDSITTFISVVALWMFIKGLCGKMKISEETGKIITGLSKDTLGIYLVHMYVLDLAGKFGIDVDIWPRIISIPLLFALSTAISFFFAAIARRIPAVGKYIC